MNSRQRRKLAAEQHNARLERERQERAERARRRAEQAGTLEAARRRFRARAAVIEAQVMARWAQEPKR